MAIHFLDAESLFVHFPKTGGTWVEEASRKTGIRFARLPERTTRWTHKHLTRRDYDCPATMAWTLVRRPDDWYVSWYCYASSRAWPDYRNLARHPQTCLADCAAETFDEFIERCLQRHPGYLSEMYSRYTEGLDFIGTMENLATDVRGILQSRIDVPVLDPTPVHVSEGRRPIWTAELHQRLLESEPGAMRIWQAALPGARNQFAGTHRAA